MDWLVLPKQLRTEALAVEDGTIIVRAAAAAPAARCPACGDLAQRLHSRYTRTLADLPWAGIPVCLRVTVRKVYCDNPAWARSIFAERFDGLA